MPTVEWINARGIRMKKHYTYSKQGISDANNHMTKLKNQGLTATVTHKYAGKTLGGSNYKKSRRQVQKRLFLRGTVIHGTGSPEHPLQSESK